MDYRRIGITVVVLVVLIWWRQSGSMPQITRAADAVLVGDSAGDHANYELRSEAELGGAVVGYDFNSFGLGGSFLAKVGGRGVISYMNSDSYARAYSASCSTGQCFGSYLGNEEAAGRIGHLILIPQDEAALKQMKWAKLPNGSRFRLKGHHLALQSAQLDGGRVSLDMGNTGYFLVASLERE